jgi:hypothetical protein
MTFLISLALPLLTVILISLFSRKIGTIGSITIACANMALVFIFSFCLLYSAISSSLVIDLWPWLALNGHNLSFTIKLDSATSDLYFEIGALFLFNRAGPINKRALVLAVRSAQLRHMHGGGVPEAPKRSAVKRVLDWAFGAKPAPSSGPSSNSAPTAGSESKEELKKMTSSEPADVSSERPLAEIYRDFDKCKNIMQDRAA